MPVHKLTNYLIDWLFEYLNELFVKFSKFFGNTEGMFFNYCENFIKLKIKHYAIVT